MNRLRLWYLKCTAKDAERNFLEELFWRFLWLLAHVHRSFWFARRTLRRLHPPRKKRLPCLVVSIGNLTTGGTGKTPVVSALARRFVQAGLKTAVVSRGYGRKTPPRSLVWVSRGEGVLTGPQEAGDEAVFLAWKVPQAAVAVCADRYLAGMEIYRNFHPDVLLLDDGFQRRFQLHRDLDILTLDGAEPFSNGQVFPAGLLREPLEALREAGCFIINKADQARNVVDVETVVRRYNPRALCFRAKYRPVGFRDLADAKRIKQPFDRETRVGVLCAVARPSSFLRTLSEAGVLVHHAYLFSDHSFFSTEKLEVLEKDAEQRGLQALVVTEKDAVKLKKWLPKHLRVFVLEIEWEILGNHTAFENVMRNLVLAAGGR